MREEEEWAAREEARRLEVEGLKAELEAVKGGTIKSVNQ